MAQWGIGVTALVALLVSYGAPAAKIFPAEFIFRNGYVYTVDPHDTVSEAIAVREGRILYVGDNAGARTFLGPKTRIIDLNGRMVMPGLIDGHIHPLDTEGMRARQSSSQAGATLEEGRQARLASTSEIELLKRAQAALEALRHQGVTTFLDAAASEPSIKAFAAIAGEGHLTARAHFAPVVEVREAGHSQYVITHVQSLIKRFDRPQASARPVINVHNAEISMDGTLQAPAQTAALLTPYLIDRGAGADPRFVEGTKRGEVNFSHEALRELIVELCRVGIEPHIHANGDRAVHEALDAIAESREEMLDATVRISIAHAELVDSSDYERFAHLGVTAVMAFQWAKPGPNSIDAVRDFLGPSRFAHLEPEGSLFAAHARIAFGSDWPADKLDEWLALKVAITRSAEAGSSRYPGRLNDEVPLPRAAAIRAMTFDAAYELHQDHQIGSLEPGKLADLIVVDRNVMKVRAEDIAQSKVLLTMVGGLVVFESEQL